MDDTISLTCRPNTYVYTDKNLIYYTSSFVATSSEVQEIISEIFSEDDE